MSNCFNLHSRFIKPALANLFFFVLFSQVSGEYFKALSTLLTTHEKVI